LNQKEILTLHLISIANKESKWFNLRS
jgi:hypothetical protein